MKSTYPPPRRLPMLRFASFLLLFLMALPAGAEESPAPSDTSWTDDPYSVTGVDVDVKGSSGVNARDKAFTDGGRTALKMLATRLSGTENPDLKDVDDNTISRLIKSFEVEKEKVSGKRYIGKLTFHFKPEATASFLDSRGLSVQPSDGPTGWGAPPSQVTAPTTRTVVLPIVRLKDRSVLWEEKTSWARAWENYLSDNPDPNFVVPEGGMEDISTIATPEALAGIPAPLMKIMKKYDAHAVLVPVLISTSLTPEPTQSLAVQLASFDSNGALRRTSSFSIPAQPKRNPMEWLQDGAAYALGFGRQQNSTLMTSVPAISTTDPSTTVARPFGFLEFTLTVSFGTPREWQRYRAALQEIPNVMRLDIKSLSHAQAILQLAYRGTRTNLDNDLAEKGLRLDEVSSGQYLLVPAVIVSEPLSPLAPEDEENDEVEEEDTSVIVAPPPVDRPARIP